MLVCITMRFYLYYLTENYDEECFKPKTYDIYDGLLFMV